MEDFDNAADAQEYQRQQQLKALTPEQREQFDQLQQDQTRQQTEKAKELRATRTERVQEEKKQILQQHPKPELHMLPREPMKDKQAQKKAEENIAYQDSKALDNLGNQFQKDQQAFLNDPSRTKMNKDFEKAAGHSKDQTKDQAQPKKQLSKAMNRAKLRQRQDRERDTGRNR